MRISLAWWNTSLSPLGKSRATDRDKALAHEVVRFLVDRLDVDCLALGEVTADDLADFLLADGLEDYGSYDGTLRSGRLQFDTGLLFRRTKLRLLEGLSVVSSRGTRNLKVANRIDMLAPNSEYPIHLFVSHWPSRLWCQQNGADRHLLGVRLRDAVQDVNQLYGRPAATVLLGDYNDEPFDASLSEQLLATRDRQLVRRTPELFYNPFWRHLGELEPHVPGDPREGICGSCYYSSGVATRWHTFDQIIFSSAFLGTSEWQLNEEYTQILKLPPLDSTVSSSDDIFDHHPVLSVIQRESA